MRPGSQWLRNFSTRSYSLNVQSYLSSLVAATGSLSSAERELSWMLKHVQDTLPNADVRAQNKQLTALVEKRISGVPLQYLLRSEYFGDLKLKCKRGVLIPRQETALATSHLAALLSTHYEPHVLHHTTTDHRLHFLDLCTGCGAIPLLLAHLLNPPSWQRRSPLFVGLDISTAAVQLAKKNLRSLPHVSLRSPFTFGFADALWDLYRCRGNHHAVLPSVTQWLRKHALRDIDIVTANPPYLSPETYTSNETEASVRDHEPESALVPSIDTSSPDIMRRPGEMEPAWRDIQHCDVFYPAILGVAEQFGAKVVLMETGGREQARRVVAMAVGMGAASRHVWTSAQIWRDQPDADEREWVDVDVLGEKHSVLVKGRGNERTVVCSRGEGHGWIGAGSHHVDDI